MINYDTFLNIKKNKDLGRNMNQTANFLHISRLTVKKYWDMNKNDFINKQEQENKRKKQSKCDGYKKEVVTMITDINDIAASTIYDRLREQHSDRINFSERTLRSYVHDLREELNIPKNSYNRVYEAVKELPPGKQAQVDFGEYKIPCGWDKTKRKKVYYFLMVLRYSRFKYVEFSDVKYTSEMAVQAHLNAFKYFGGIPQEIVYDQDRAFIVSENHGDIIETDLFKSFLANMPFTHYIARKADPESKGVVERYIGHIKVSFLRGRAFINIEELNRQALDWLERTGNYNICQTINERPVDRIEQERQALYPIDKIRKDHSFTEIIPHKVNKDNTVTYQGNRYRLPYDTYNNTRNHEVGIQVIGEQLFILDLLSHKQIINHPLCHQKGKLIGEKEEKPLRLSLAKKLIAASNCFNPYSIDASDFLQLVCLRHPRYLPDQMDLIIQSFEDNKDVLTKEALLNTLEICQAADNYSATAFNTVLTNQCNLIRQDKIVDSKLKENPEESRTMAFYSQEDNLRAVANAARIKDIWESVK